MSKSFVLFYIVIVILVEKTVSFPREIYFEGESYRVEGDNRLLRVAKKCTGNRLGLYVPYNAVKFFWSGFGVADSDKVAAEIAQHVAEKEGKKGVTLETLLELEENRHIKPCKWTVPVTPECRQFWQDLSCEYASTARGEVRVILGPRVSPTSAWLTTEKDQLEYLRSNGQDLWGFKQYELESVYCKDMATHQTRVPEIKQEICMRKV
ncbi:unnamed protein product [Adineta ricciae]|uniref:Uncharacterized protein n=2 Tax=Adineta ricciae TaxID=249248 RepID=A0A814NHG3_ADIRI|nr:unnamed protein product [Adineta ricciae]